MINHNENKMFESKHFKEGIVNGSEWYPIIDSLSEYLYLIEGIPNLTIEVSKKKMHVL